MPLLIQIGFTHYAPKDSTDGIKEFIIADNMEQALKYINEEYLHGELFDEDEYNEERSFYPGEEWWKKNEHKRKTTKDFGLEIDEFDDVKGLAKNLTIWLEGTHWQEVSDAYYGVTQYDWSKYQEISTLEAALLVKELRIAKDIRGLNENKDV
jgi:hypothetical protein